MSPKRGFTPTLIEDQASQRGINRLKGVNLLSRFTQKKKRGNEYNPQLVSGFTPKLIEDVRAVSSLAEGKRPRSSLVSSGFTLVEFLVYAAIFAIVVGLLTSIFLLIINAQKKESVSGEVSQQLNFILGTVQRLVEESSLIEITYEGQSQGSTCANFCTLKLRRIEPAKDPTLVSSDVNGIYLKEGSGPTVTLTNDKVIVNNLKFVKHETPGAHAVVEINTSLSYKTSNPRFAVTKAIESAIARVSAATFDADLLPNQDATFDIGQVSGSNLRWRSGRFSQDLTVAGKVGIGTTSPNSSALLDITSTNKGLLAPRLTTAQRDAVASPANGLFLYNTTTGSFNFYNGSSWKEVSSDTGPSYVTSLPGSPTDGQEVYYVVDTTNRIVWHLRYNAGSSSSYKWEFLGGSPLYSAVHASESRSSSVYGDLATIGPSVTLPRAGDYLVTTGWFLESPGTGAMGSMSYAIGSTAAHDGNRTASGRSVNVSRTQYQIGLGAVTLTAKYKSNDGITLIAFKDRWMSVMPVRIQ